MHIPSKLAIFTLCVPGILAMPAIAQTGNPYSAALGNAAATSRQEGPVSAAAASSSQSDSRNLRIFSGPSTSTLDTANYVLGPEDQITVRVFTATDFPDKPTEIANDGNVTLPMIGKVHAAGLTVEQLQAVLVTEYKKYFKDPEVMIQVTDFRSQPVSVAGEVNQPGVIQLRGNRNLMEVISQAGGVRPDAGNTVLITRSLSEGSIPLSGAFTDPSGKFSVARVNIQSVLDGRDPMGNIMIKPHDVITVSRAKMIYVLGNVNKPGGFVLSDSESISVSQALALAGGWDHTASLKNARVLRAEDGTHRVEVAANIDKIMENKAPDLQLKADDILYVPNSVPKSATYRALEAGIQMGTGLAIWR